MLVYKANVSFISIKEIRRFFIKSFYNMKEIWWRAGGDKRYTMHYPGGNIGKV